MRPRKALLAVLTLAVLVLPSSPAAARMAEATYVNSSLVGVCQSDGETFWEVYQVGVYCGVFLTAGTLSSVRVEIADASAAGVAGWLSFVDGNGEETELLPFCGSGTATIPPNAEAVYVTVASEAESDCPPGVVGSVRFDLT